MSTGSFDPAAITVDQFNDAITVAIAAHDFQAVVDLLRVMAVAYPREASDTYDMIKLGLRLNKSSAPGGAS